MVPFVPALLGFVFAWWLATGNRETVVPPAPPLPQPPRRLPPGPVTIHDKAPAPNAAQRNAAKALQALLRAPGANFGSKAKPNDKVRELQRSMGGLTADGIVGSKTEARAKLLGYPLPAKPTLTLTTTPPGAPSSPARLMPPAPSPAPRAQDVSIATRRATMQPGTQYRATLLLTGFDSLATNDQVLARIQAAVGPWKNPKVTGSGASRVATGTYSGSKREVTLPQQVTKLQIVPSSAPLMPPAPSPAAPSSAPAPSSTDRQKSAAQALQAYLKSSADWGSRAKPNAVVRLQQAQMSGLVADGIMGPKTEARMRALGYPAPAKPRAMITAPISSSLFPAAPPPAPPAKPAAAAVRPPALSPLVPSSPAAAAASVTPAQSAARALDAYVMSGGRDRSKIADQQWTLGLDADGIAGAGTKAAVAKQLGRAPAWPATLAPTGAIPGGASKLQAAERLERYWAVGGRRAERIAAYQRVLGVAADGQVGANTRSAASSALGRTAKLA